ncbi:MAG TPA: hypothetical protein VLM37_08740, partial [Fibrobacteraceae bacterium]|nr:hypothetical protein [Fibrobacteraceae bacterium]
HGLRRAFVWTLTILGFFPLLGALAFLFRLRWFQVALIALSLIPIASYWSVTPYSVRSHDVSGAGGHIGYVAYIAEHWTLPKPNEGWTYYHPPLYYIGGALCWKVANLVGAAPSTMLQAFSLALWLIFLTASASALRYSLRGQAGLLALATLLLAFWPSGPIHSIRVGNDIMLYANVGVAVWFLTRW